MALGIGLTVTNTKAVMEALFGIKTAFKRTPKYRIEKRGQVPQASKYRKRLGIVPWIELLIGSYFALTIWYAIVNENYFTVPFLLLFVLGYWYTGLMSLLEGRFERFRMAAPMPMNPRPSPSPWASSQAQPSVHAASSFPSGSVKWKRDPPGKEKMFLVIFPPASLICFSVEGRSST